MNNSENWKVLIVEDDIALQTITKISLKRARYKNKQIEILQAYSAAEAIEILCQHNDIAIVFLDIKMETPDAGLNVIEHVRARQNNKLLRIVVRTGQQEIFPEKSALSDYDIDDYRDKKNVNAASLTTITYANLKVYDKLRHLQSTVKQLANSQSAEDESKPSRDLEAGARHSAGNPLSDSQLDNEELSAKDQRFLKQWNNIIENLYREESTNVEKLALSMKISPRQLLTKVKTLLGKGPKDILTEYRIVQAKSLLETKPMSISGVAEAVGFRNLSHFCTAFKGVTGQTPSAYRQIMLSDDDRQHRA